MNLKLTRNDSNANGIFGVLTDEANNQIAVTLEHSYDTGNGNGSYGPKTPPGVYVCKRSSHRLHNMDHDFTTFEVTNVPGHTNILVHWGNYNADSDGCILVGDERNGDMIMNSKVTFAKFMSLQDGVDQFTLTIV
jgi:hypothetical protein